MHERGVVFNDLHMFNIMVDRDEQPSAARLRGRRAGRRGRAASPWRIRASSPPPDRRGFDVDRYALACLRLALFLPLTSAAADRPGQGRPPRRHRRRPVPGRRARSSTRRSGTIAEAPPRAGMPTTRTPGDGVPFDLPGDWPAAARLRWPPRSSPAAPRSATTGSSRATSPSSRAGGGLGLAHGAAGVLYALAETGAAGTRSGEEWLLRAPRRRRGHPARPLRRAARRRVVLDRLGHTPTGPGPVERVWPRAGERLGPDLHGGVAGFGLTLDDLGGRPDDDAACDAAGGRACRGRGPSRRRSAAGGARARG